MIQERGSNEQSSDGGCDVLTALSMVEWWSAPERSAEG